ncbi:MAG TPA: hypothetical protein DEO57_04425 [Phycisphaerales bacterium]|nr:hypothetical protein [Phycisphaerales bacterium]
MEAHEARLKIAVVGGGIAGIASAWMLSRKHDVTLIEAADRLGGHNNTIPFDEDGVTVPVDTGFIVCNERNYPVFYGLLDEWGATLRDSDMSFGFSCESSGLGYVGPSMREFTRYRSNVLRPVYWKLFFSQRRFARHALKALDRGDLGDATLGTFLDRIGMDDFFVHNYLIPLAASVWSSPDTDMLDFPAETFLRFFHNHGMIQVRDIPRWQTVVGGSCAYIDRFRDRFTGTIRTGAPVEGIRREAGSVRVAVTGDAPAAFDHVVLATHADRSLAMLSDATEEERSALSRWTYHRSAVVLHTDASVLPADRRLWASWNYRRPPGAAPADPVPITYWMNRLQGLESDRDYLVSLNLRRAIPSEHVIYEIEYEHPAYVPDCIAAQQSIRRLGGAGNTHFCGSYMGYGFHEDAAASAHVVAQRLGCV